MDVKGSDDKGQLLAFQLHAALGSGDQEFVEQTLAGGADPNTNFAGETGLHVAAERQQKEIVASLLRYGADPSPQTRFYKLTPLHIAADLGDVEIVRRLVEAGADDTARTIGGWTPLHAAVGGGHLRVARLLVERGADVNAVNKAGETVLHFIKGTDLNLFAWLAEQVVTIDVSDEHSATPLTYAAAYGRRDIAAILLRKGASPDHRDEDGITPAEWARQKGFVETADLIDKVCALTRDVIARELHDELHKGAFDLLLPYLECGDHRVVTSEADRLMVERGCQMLKRAFALNPLNWAAMWASGMAYRAIGDSQLALTSFREAYAIERVDTNVGRELAHECIRLGRADEAVSICLEVLEMNPFDAGLIANYGLALLISKRIEEASHAVEASLSLSPDYPITLQLASLVTAVKEGRHPAPDRWPTLLRDFQSAS
jgi:tetratricopeptide (TPR) repeat protein